MKKLELIILYCTFLVITNQYVIAGDKKASIVFGVFAIITWFISFIIPSEDEK